MIFDDMVKNVNNKVSKFLMYPRIVLLFDTMLVHQGEGSGTPTEPHYTPFPEVESSHPTTSSIPLPSIPTAPIPTVTQLDTTPIIQYSRRARIAPSSPIPTVADETASPVRDVSEGEACPTASGSIADQDRATIASLDKSNETIAKYLQEYQEFASELPLEKKIELIRDLVKYQEHYTKVYKFQRQQRKPMTKKQKREYYMAVIKSNLGWRFKDFKGMTFEEIEVKFAEVWKQVEDFIPMGSKEESKRLKRKGLNLEKEQVKKQKSLEEAPEIETTPKEFTEEKIKEMMQIRNDSEEIARVLTSMDAATVLAGETNVPTGSGFIPTAGPPATIISTGSEVGPTASLIVRRRKGKEVMVESDTPKKKKLQEQIDAQVARELEEQQLREDMRMNEQIARDAEVARIHAEEEIQ
nr:hypothetical protein [Tanacetum cinerariifolium]